MTETSIYKAIVYLFPSMAGAFISLKFLPNDVTIGNKVFSFISSLFIAHFGGRGIAEHYGFIEGVESGVILTTGMIGLTVVSHIVSEIPKTFNAIREKYFGDDR